MNTFASPPAALARLFVIALLWLPLASTAQYAGIDTGSTVTQSQSGPSTLERQGAVADTTPGDTLDDADQPFGANLFTGGFAGEREDGINPDYIIASGDRIELRVWGATEINEILTVDPKGNIFVPKVGPVTVSGVRNDQLNRHVTASIRRVYTDNVQVYTSLSSTQPVAVFVTGFVKNPGRFAGVASNSILYFIDRAAGIDPERGSFRNIDILRNQRRIATADLYAFLLSGKLPSVQLRDGDTILVRPRGNTVTVDGDTRNTAVFELVDNRVEGRQLLQWARPLAGASHVLWTGVRNGTPEASYLPLSAIADKSFEDGDRLEVLTDAHHDLITVKVEGMYEGPSQFVVSKHARLGEVLDMVQVPPELAAHESISIKRQSIREQQRQTIEESLRRLENAYLRASSETDVEAAIRTSEVQLIQDFVKRARQVEPNGRLVLRNPAGAADIRLQDGDVITIPERTESVLITGEILIPQAILFDAAMTLEDYIALSGGLTELADPEAILLLRQNGEVLLADGMAPRPGDQLMVLPKVPSKNLQFAASIIDIIYKVAISAGVLVNI